MTRHLITLAALVTMVAAGCSLGGGSEPDAPAYTPVPDATLFDEVAAVDGVETSETSYQDKPLGDRRYYASVTVDPDADPLEVADQVYAILHQGRPRTNIALEVVQGDRIIDTSSVVPLGRWIELEERYGPQPGDGLPPED